MLVVRGGDGLATGEEVLAGFGVLWATDGGGGLAGINEPALLTGVSPVTEETEEAGALLILSEGGSGSTFLLSGSTTLDPSCVDLAASLFLWNRSKTLG